MADDPVLLAAQCGLLLLGFLLVYLVFFTTRDCLLRSSSFLFTCFSILLVSMLPVAGFLLYILIRPATTVHERETAKMIRHIHDQLKKQQQHKQHTPEKQEKKDEKGRKGKN